MAIEFRSIRFARDLAFAACAAAMLTAPVVAQVPDSSIEPSTERRPTTIVGGNQSPVQTFERCVDVQIGGERGLGCLNEKLRREVQRVNPSINFPPLDARSPDVKIGNVNEAAVREQYGSNYGRSVFPYRPTAIFAPPRR
jgi:hypothetical protein